MTDTAVIFDIIGRDRTSDAIAASGNAFNKFAIGLAAGAAFASAKFVDMAANFQQGMTRLKTGAGEVDSNMSLVSRGILEMAGQVGESTKDLLSGMYLIESAGYHGADGLNVLRVAAEGAKVGNADMATVADAVTTALNAYHMGAGKATEATNALIAAEGQGKTNLEALSGSLSTVAPIASLAGVKFNELVAAMATMTAQGTDANSAATYLKQTIGQLSNPTAKARAEMEALGLDATKVSMNLGENGLASTLKMLTDAIQAKMGPAGTVLIEQLSKASGNADKFQQILANLPPTQQTFIGALATMTGGTKSMQAALELTGANMQVFEHNTDVVNEKVKAGGNTIEGWADVQKNFNQQMAEAKGKTEAMGIAIGQALMPQALNLLNAISSLVSFLGRHAEATKIAADALLIGAGAFLTFRVAAIAAEVATKEYMIQTNIYKGAVALAAAAQWVWNASLYGFPLVWIILAIMAVIAAIVLCIKYHKQIAEFFIYVWGKIWDFMKAVGEWFAGPFVNFFKTIGAWFAGPFVQFFVNMGKAIAAPFLWFYNTIIVPTFNGIKAVVVPVFNVISQIVMSFAHLFYDLGKIFIMNVYQQLIKPAMDGIGAAFTWLWHNIIEPAVNGIIMYFQMLAAVYMWLWHNVVEPAGQGIAAAAMWLWQNIFVPVGNGIMAAINAVGNAVVWVWHNLLDPAFHAVASTAQWFWSVVVGVFDAVMSKVNAVGSVFSSVFHSIGGFISDGFNAGVGIVKGAMNNIIGIVNRAVGFVNHDVIDVANMFPGVHFPHIPNIPYLARGGTMLQAGVAVVGERGPELVTLPAGATVHPNGSAVAVQGGGAGGRQVLELRIKGGADQAIGKLLHELKRRGILEFALVSEVSK